MHGIQISWNESIPGCTFNLYRGTTPGGEGTSPFVSGIIASPYLIVQPTATFTVEPCALGAPIMREGFITETGFLLTPRQGGLYGGGILHHSGRK